MAALLPTNYFGTGVAAKELDNGNTCIYYQGSNGAIYHTGGVGSAASSAKYCTGVILIPATDVRFNTPIAFVSWGVSGGINSFDESRLYFIDRNNQVRELSYSRSTGKFEPGSLDGQNYKAAPNSGFLYAINTSGGSVRVGFQSASDLGFITEAALSGQTWTAARLV
ncbi:hypothetical protein K439DRAFT_1621502 [Ramaria rubella]|nr:hypothetical protein K439DRAFT_1621502 [Ramaria rubella]